MKKIVLAMLLVSVAGISAASAEIVTCSSNGHDQNYCRVDTRDGVVLVHQLSKAGCWQGDTWGYDRGGIWVSNGCRAEFKVGRNGSDWASSLYHNSQSSDQVNWNDPRDVDRWADQHSNRIVHGDDQRKDDKVGAAVGAALAVGVIAAIAANNDHHDGRRQPARAYVCESVGKDHRYCDVGTIHHAQVKRQLSRSPCEYNRSWGYDRRGIWVGNGCRAEFWVE